MVSIRRISSLVIAVLAGVGLSFCSEAMAISTQQSDAIVQNCNQIKQSLVKLQHADSRTRTYLGSAYEAISGRFITPLNLRLIRNNIPSAELFRIQNDFVAAQTDFRNKYVDYMRELENLIAADCSAHPEDFYNLLTSVRNKREELRLSTKKISDLASEQYKTVEELKETL